MIRKQSKKIWKSTFCSCGSSSSSQMSCRFLQQLQYPAMFWIQYAIEPKTRSPLKRKIHTKMKVKYAPSLPKSAAMVTNSPLERSQKMRRYERNDWKSFST